MPPRNNQPAALSAGAHHVGLSVPDLGRARDFFVETLGFQQVAERPDYPAVFVSDGGTMITLWQAQESARGFDRRGNLGLHHLALRVAPGVKLEAVHERLLARGVEVEFAPQPVGDAGARHLMCSTPGGLRLEFFQDDA